MSEIKSNPRKRWTEREDLFLHAFADAIGASYIGPHDLGRSAKATKDRISFLKKSGAWKAMDQMVAWRKEYRSRAGLSVAFFDDSVPLEKS